MEMLGLVLLVLFGGLSLIALLAAVHLLMPGTVDPARAELEDHLGRSFLIGLVNLVFGGALAVVLLWLAGLIRDSWASPAAFLAVVLGFLALVLVLGLAVLAVNGLAALMVLLGRRIGKIRTPFWGEARGGLLLVLACLTPYVGWFGFTPFVLCLGLGGSLAALARSRARR